MEGSLEEREGNFKPLKRNPPFSVSETRELHDFVTDNQLLFQTAWFVSRFFKVKWREQWTNLNAWAAISSVCLLLAREGGRRAQACLARRTRDKLSQLAWQACRELGELVPTWYLLHPRACTSLSQAHISLWRARQARDISQVLSRVTCHIMAQVKCHVSRHNTLCHMSNVTLCHIMSR